MGAHSLLPYHCSSSDTLVYVLATSITDKDYQGPAVNTCCQTREMNTSGYALQV